MPIVDATHLGRRGGTENATFTIRPGEVFGLAGLLGSGRTETVRLLFGLDASDQGSLQIDGRPAGRLTPRRAIQHGFAFCSEDRKHEGLFPEMSIRENIIIALQGQRGWLRPLSGRRQRELGQELATRLHVQPPDIERPIQFLSGGNQQKALLARWLAIEPRLLLLDEPTRGIDVGAKFEIMSLIDNLREQGVAFVFVSSELPEMVRTCTRVLVMRDRKAVEILESNEITEERIIGTIAGSGY
jgi:simple sugar transport system ATP-binding protein